MVITYSPDRIEQITFADEVKRGVTFSTDYWSYGVAVYTISNIEGCIAMNKVKLQEVRRRKASKPPTITS